MNTFRYPTKTRTDSHGREWHTVKTITSYTGLARFYAGDGAADGLPTIGYLAATDDVLPVIKSVGCSGPTRVVHAYRGRNVIIRETSHRHYEIVVVPKAMPVYPTDEQAEHVFVQFLAGQRSEQPDPFAGLVALGLANPR